jgi:hypothetical protein
MLLQSWRKPVGTAAGNDAMVRERGRERERERDTAAGNDAMVSAI